MITNLIFFLAISSGSIYAATKYNRKYEEVLPITCFGIILVLFMLGITGHLVAGVVLNLCSITILYGLAIFNILCNKEVLPRFIKNIVTPSSITFFLFFLLANYALYGKLAYCYIDEFTHWVDVVKVMTIMDILSTDPLSNSMFQSYPPAMALFQYFLNRIFTFFNVNQNFSEWRVYLAYQTVLVAVIVPFLHVCIKGKYSIAKLMITCIVTINVLLFYFPTLADAAYIDPFLGVVAFAGTGMIFCTETKDKGKLYIVYEILTIIVLTLTKDVGMLFALFQFCLFIGDLYLSGSMYETTNFKKWLFVGLSIFLCFIPKMLWLLNIKWNCAKVQFESKIDLGIFFSVVSNHDIGDYRYQTFRNFFNAFTETMLPLCRKHILISELVWIILILGTLLLLLYFAKKHHLINAKQYFLYSGIEIMQLLIYIFGMCLMYMFNFNEYEAVRLASFQRYLNIIFLPYSLQILFLYNRFVSYEIFAFSWKHMVVVLLGALLICPHGIAKKYITRYNVGQSIQDRKVYSDVVDKFNGVCSKSSKVWIISQSYELHDIYHWLVLRFSVRPSAVIGAFSIGKPFYKDDLWTKEYNRRQWMNELIKNQYDYVCLYKTNQYFVEEFGALFSDPLDIKERCLYKVDSNLRKLVFVK